VPRPTPSAYEQLGGQAGVVRLVDRFYDLMDSLEVAAAIRALHDDDLTADRHKLAAFLSGWLGGPKLYWHRHTPGELHARHRHLPVDEAAKEAWLACMRGALADTVEDEGLRERLGRRFTAVAGRVVNRGAPTSFDAPR
jgi:hemoglobin